MINELIKLANHLDDNGDYRQANYLDKMIRKNAQHATAAKIAKWLKKSKARSVRVLRAGGRMLPWILLEESIWSKDTASDDDCGNCYWAFAFFKEVYKEFYDYHNEYGYPKKLNNILTNPKWHREVVAEHNILWISDQEVKAHQVVRGRQGEHWVQDPGLDDHYKPCCVPRWRPTTRTALKLQNEIKEYFDSTEYKTLIAFWDCYNDPDCRKPNAEGIGGDYREENMDPDFDEDTDTDMDDGSDSDTDTSTDTDVHVKPTGKIEGMENIQEDYDSPYVTPNPSEEYSLMEHYTNDFNFYRGGDMINELIKLATHLDGKGHYREANYVDEMIRKEAFAWLPVLYAIAGWIGLELVGEGTKRIFAKPDHLEGKCQGCFWPYLALSKFLIDDVPEIREMKKLEFLRGANYDDQNHLADQLLSGPSVRTIPRSLRNILDNPVHQRGVPHVGTEAAEAQKEQERWPDPETSCCTPSWLPNARMNDVLITALRAWVETDLQKELDAQEQRMPELGEGAWRVDPCPSCHKPDEDSDTWVERDWDWDWEQIASPEDLEEGPKSDFARWLEESAQASPGSSSDQYYTGRGGQYPTR